MTIAETCRRILASLLIALAALGPAACSGDRSSTGPGEPLPPWLVRVFPEPGDRSATYQRIEVDHRVTTGDENIRLTVDGTDVTAYAEFGRETTVGGPGRLAYDPADADQVVPLDPGRHRATVERVRLTEMGGEAQVLDSYSWEFEIQ